MTAHSPQPCGVPGGHKPLPDLCGGTRLRRHRPSPLPVQRRLRYSGRWHSLTTRVLETQQCVFSMTPATGLCSDPLSKQSKTLSPSEHSKAKHWVEEIPSFIKSAAQAPSSGFVFALTSSSGTNRPLSLCQLIGKIKRMIHTGKPEYLT